MFTIDTTSNATHFVILCDGKELFQIAKSVNSLDAVKEFVGLENIKEII